MLNIIGTPSVSKPLFYIAKGSIVACAAFPFLKGSVDTIEINITAQHIFGLFFLIAGSIIFIISLVNLGKSTRVGIPEEETQLKVTGLYSFSRNPMYLGVFMLCIASCLYVPHILNFIFATLVISIHHIIIKKEEIFLEQRFKNQWFEYKNKVRRYI